MIRLSFIFLLPAMACLVYSCKHERKKPVLSGEAPVAIGDFIEYFEVLNLPFQYADTSFPRNTKQNDSSLISYTVFSQFVPDTILRKWYGKSKPRIYAVGKIEVPKNETYLWVHSVYAGRDALLLLVFNKKKELATAFPALIPDHESSTQQVFNMDRQYTITQSVTRKNKDGSMSEGKDVYAFNRASGAFDLIMTDALEDKPTELVNPIDTLPGKLKYSGDYVKNKMNLVSIRDGRRPDRITFFIHFDNEKGCFGELKGEAMLKSANTAEYNKDGDPCKLKFLFASNSVTLKEIEGCGSYRPLNCTFDGSYPKKPEPKTRQAPAKKKNR